MALCDGQTFKAAPLRSEWVLRCHGVRHSGHLGDRLSFFRMLRWKRDGARHTAMFMGVIWFSSTEEVTSLRKHRRVWSTSRFSSDMSMMAACTACSLCSLGTSEVWWGSGGREGGGGIRWANGRGTTKSGATALMVRTGNIGMGSDQSASSWTSGACHHLLSKSQHHADCMAAAADSVKEP